MNEKDIIEENEVELFDETFKDCECDASCDCESDNGCGCQHEHDHVEVINEGEIEDEFIKLQIIAQKQNDLLLRTAAEFDNYKKRVEKERESLGQQSRANVIKSMLPAIDNINLAMVADSTSVDYLKGIELSLKSLTDSLKDIGLDEFGKEGETFNPNIHEAVMHVEDESIEENIIAQVFKSGYKVGDTVIRPAMVKVAN